MDNRQLDALVAQARGLRPCSDPIGRCDAAHTDPPQCWGTPDKHGVVHGSDLRAYSTDIAEAMALVEEWPGDYEIERMIGQYGVTLDRRVIATADTLPEAICLAYLKAKGVEV